MRTVKERIGNFTSSGIADLMTNGRSGGLGKPALTYIEEKNMERRLGRALSREVNAQALTWGKLCERQVFDLLGLEYKLCSDETIVHPEYSFWSGSPDAEKFDEGKTLGEIKCPITLKSFCQLVDGGTIEAVRENHKEGDTYFYQCISNAILTGAKYAELIVYVPYLHELNEIRELCSSYENPDAVRWINWADDEQLPYLIEGGHYKNLNIIRWEVAQEDKDALTERVIEASNFLTDKI